ncbi:MAG: mechanosensitive ion channel family protein [Anaerolineae bacterium]|nr:mechanosensitive ion channel family protein [Anaerolineae bacterium]
MDVNTLIEFGVWLALIVGVMLLGLIAVRLARRGLLKSINSSTKMPDGRKKQIQTIVQVAGWMVNVALIGIAVMMLLSRFVDITPLLTSLGVVGLALSLGAQTLIKDLIGGLMVLIENQYAVGDVIQVGDVSGVVERLTLRATYVRDVGGKLYLVPNGDIRVVGNVTRDWSRAMVDIGVAYEENLERVTAVLDQVARQFAGDPAFAPQLLEPPAVIAPLSLGDWAVTIRVMIKTLPGKQWGTATELRKRILAACERENITLPYPRQEVFVRNQPGFVSPSGETNEPGL